MERKILVAVDGSIYSKNTIQYLSRLFQDMGEIRFHLLCIVPCGSLPPERQWLDELELMSTISPESRKRLVTAKHSIHEAVRQFGRRGIGPAQITSRVKLAQGGVASDIMNEARQGLYDALVIGRRGLGKLEEMMLGSTSTSILEQCYDLPIWLVDGQVDSRTFLVPVDGSPHTLKAIDHLSFILKDNPHTEITLFYSDSLFARRQPFELHEFHDTQDEVWCEQHLNRPDSHFHAPEQLLLDNGIPADRIHRLETRQGMYPSRQIVRQALMDDFGTIVMGRRGKDVKKGLLGSVSGRVMAMAVDTAIWIIG